MSKTVKCYKCGKRYDVKLVDKKGLCIKCRKMSDTTPAGIDLIHILY